MRRGNHRTIGDQRGSRQPVAGTEEGRIGEEVPIRVLATASGIVPELNISDRHIGNWFLDFFVGNPASASAFHSRMSPPAGAFALLPPSKSNHWRVYSR